MPCTRPSTSRREPPTPEITVSPSSNPQVVKSHVHRASLPEPATQPFRNTRVTSPARTAFDLGRSRGTHTFVVAADAALNSKTATLAELEGVAAVCWNWPGIRRGDARAYLARSTIGISARIDQPPCRFGSKDSLTLSPKRESGRRVADRRPRRLLLGRVRRVVGEADGLANTKTMTMTLQAEKLRQEHLEQLGLVVVRWVWNDVTRKPGQLATRLRAAFARGAAQSRSGSLRRWSILPPEPDSLSRKAGSKRN